MILMMVIIRQYKVKLCQKEKVDKLVDQILMLKICIKHRSLRN